MCNLVNKAGAVVDISDVHPVCSLLPVICERPPVGVSTTSSKLSLWWFFHQWWLFSSQVQNPSVSIHIDIKIHCILMDLLFLILYIAGIGLLQWNYSYINYPISEYYISKYKSSLWSNLRNFVSMVVNGWSAYSILVQVLNYDYTKLISDGWLIILYAFHLCTFNM